MLERVLIPFNGRCGRSYREGWGGRWLRDRQQNDYDETTQKGRGGIELGGIQKSLEESLCHDFMGHDPTRVNIIELHKRDSGASHSYSRPGDSPPSPRRHPPRKEIREHFFRFTMDLQISTDQRSVGSDRKSQNI